MSNATLTRPVFTSDAAAIAGLYGIPVVESKVAQQRLAAIKGATPATLVAALAEHGRPLYGDTTALAEDVAAAEAFVKQGKGTLDAAQMVAVRIVMTARKVNAKVTATALARAVEGDPVDAKAAAAQRKRWSRYVAAAKMTAARAEAIDAGRTDQNLSIRQALTALQNAYAPQDVLLAAAESGAPMPSKADAAAVTAAAVESGEVAPKPVKVATLVERLAAVSDLTKRVTVSDLTDTDRAEVARILANIATRLGVK